MQKIKNTIPYKRDTCVLTQIKCLKSFCLLSNQDGNICKESGKTWLDSPTELKSMAINELQDRARLYFVNKKHFSDQKLSFGSKIKIHRV